MWLFKIKGKAKIPDYIQIRDEKMILVDYFRADRPIEKFKKYGNKAVGNKIQRVSIT